jgi:hypothetical protein
MPTDCIGPRGGRTRGRQRRVGSTGWRRVRRGSSISRGRSKGRASMARTVTLPTQRLGAHSHSLSSSAAMAARVAQKKPPSECTSPTRSQRASASWTAISPSPWSSRRISSRESSAGCTWRSSCMTPHCSMCSIAGLVSDTPGDARPTPAAWLLTHVVARATSGGTSRLSRCSTRPAKERWGEAAASSNPPLPQRRHPQRPFTPVFNESRGLHAPSCDQRSPGPDDAPSNWPGDEPRPREFRRATKPPHTFAPADAFTVVCMRMRHLVAAYAVTSALRSRDGGD